MGCDVRAADVPLTEFGWTFRPRPNKKKGCARLAGRLPDGGHCSVWGFGFLAVDAAHGALWLDRKGFRPVRADRIDPTLPVFEVKDLPACHAPADVVQSNDVLFLLGQLAERLAVHEAECLSRFGAGYRRRCVDEWKFRRTALEPEAVPSQWRELAGILDTMRIDMNKAKLQEVSA